MNLIDYSFKNNIEFGVYVEKTVLSQITANNFFDSTFKTCLNIVEDDGYTIFVKRPKYKKKLLFAKDYVGSEIELNLVEDLLLNGSVNKCNFSEFRDETYVNAALKEERKPRDEITVKLPAIESNTGHCIRCRTNISLNIDKPLCRICYIIWSQFGDPNYSENFCLVCGDKKKTSLYKPICYPCFKK